VSGLTPEMADLLESMCLGELSPDEANRLEMIVSANDEQCRHYIRFMYMNALAERSDVADVKQESQLSESLFPNVVIAPDVPEVPSLQVSGAPLHGAMGFFSSGWPVAYLIATVICGIGMLMAAFTYVSQPVQVAEQSPTVTRDQPSPEPKTQTIGRITGMVDCRFDQCSKTSDSKTQGPRPKTIVSLGDRFALASGLMEITYNTGAKVILQGPVTYEVDAKDGGFLSLGKLTARVEKKRNDEGRMMNDELQPMSSDTHHSSPITHHLFSVRTSTITVTDLGTEFEVEVKPKGPTEVHVCQGEVEILRQGRTGAAPVKQRLVAGEAIRFASATAVPERISLPTLPLTTDSLRMIPKARSASLLAPVGLVATAYHRVWDVGGKLAAENDRQQAFRVATDGVFGRGENGQGPRSSFDTLGANHSKTHFVGLLYSRPMRFDRIKVFCGRQFADGGSWREMPQVFILKNPVDPGSMPPEDDPTNWRAIPLRLSYGPSFGGKADANPGEVLEFVLTVPAESRTGYGWAVGGGEGNGEVGYLSVTELRAYGMEVNHGL
jgi:hypothetical protein